MADTATTTTTPTVTTVTPTDEQKVAMAVQFGVPKADAEQFIKDEKSIKNWKYAAIGSIGLAGIMGVVLLSR